VFDLDIEFLKEHGIIKITTRGAFNMAANAQLANAAMEASERFGSRHFLVDQRNIHLELTTMDLYEVPHSVQRLGIDKTFVSALLYMPAPDVTKLFGFFEAMCKLANIPLRLCTDEQAAMEWLIQSLAESGK